ncbi:hypothetical protein Dimus_007003 [Dionaea muscipula]
MLHRGGKILVEQLMVMMFIMGISMMGEKGLAMAQAQAQGHSSCRNTFFSALVQLIPCRASVTPYSPIPPTDSCCSAIKALGQPCLCVLINGPPISGVDRTMALMLPDKCLANFGPCEMARKRG